MELGFVLAALRRRWWVVALSTALFAFLSSLVFGTSTVTYRSDSVLLVLPNSQGGIVQSFGNADRYVASQLAAMESETFNDRVALRLGDGETAQTIGGAVSLSNDTGTDVVTVAVFAASPQRAESIAAAFAEVYVESLREQLNQNQASATLRLADDLEVLRSRIEVLNSDLAAAVERFLPQLAEGIPIDPAFVDPQTTTERNLVTLEYEQVLNQKIALERGQQVSVNSAILQSASTAASPFVESSNFEIAAAIAGGFALGCVIALLWSRFSSLVADQTMVSDILDHPIAASVPRVRRLGSEPVTALTDVPEELREPMGRLAVAAESPSPITRSSIIIVAGAQRSAGASTLAMLLAHEFIAVGRRVLLIDADATSNDLSNVMGGADLTYDEAVSIDLADYSFEDVVTVGPSNARGLERSDVDHLLGHASQSGRVVIVDAGSVLASATSVDLCNAADAVLMAVPTERQRIASLTAVSRILKRQDMLVVTTEPKRRAMIRRTSPREHEAANA